MPTPVVIEIAETLTNEILASDWEFDGSSVANAVGGSDDDSDKIYIELRDGRQFSVLVLPINLGRWPQQGRRP